MLNLFILQEFNWTNIMKYALVDFNH